jgi:hypothetical protein
VRQSQKEIFVNEIASRIDALLHPAIEGEKDSPPSAPGEGESWLVGKAPLAEWQDYSGQIASFQSGNWLFSAPLVGMRVYNKTKGQVMYWHNGWTFAAKPAAPSGGTTIDSEARTAIVGIIAALVAAGILPAA